MVNKRRTKRQDVTVSRDVFSLHQAIVFSRTNLRQSKASEHPRQSDEERNHARLNYALGVRVIGMYVTFREVIASEWCQINVKCRSEQPPRPSNH